MASRHAGGSFAVEAGDGRFVGPDDARALAADRHVECVENRSADASAGVWLGDHDLQMIEQATWVRSPDFNVGKPCPGGMAA